MGKLQTFSIVLANAGVYYAGQVVQGHIILSLNEPLKMREIRLTLDGSANVRWTEQHQRGSGSNRTTHTVSYTNHEKYVHFKQTVYNPSQQGSEHHPAGNFQYPFSFQLPPTLPSSFEGEHGNVRYFIKGTIDRPWRFDHTCKTMFTVVANFDLNQLPQLINPVENKNEKTLCCLCCASGPITAVMRLNRTGFVPGEYILINGECDNKSNRTMNASYVKLRQYVTFHATTKSRTEHKAICEVRHGEIQEGETDVYMNQPLMIPALPPSQLIGCRIIDIKYTLTLTVDPSGPGFDLDVPLEVTIGTIPYQNIQSSYCTSMPGMPITAPPAIQPPADPNMGPPPPSYAECVFGKVNVRDDDDTEYTKGEMSWAPTYPFYSWANPQPGVLPPAGPTMPATSGTMMPAPPDGYAPPPGGYAPPPGAPQAGYAPPPGGYAPPPGAPPTGYAPPPGGYAPPPSAPQAGYAPPPGAPPAGYAPFPDGSQPGFAPPAAGQPQPGFGQTAYAPPPPSEEKI